MRELTFIAQEGGDIQVFLQSFHIAKKTINDMIQNQMIAINGIETKANTGFKKHDLITVVYYEETTIKPYYQQLEIVFEDDDILVVNKPIALLVHPDGNSEQTLDNMVYAYFLQKNTAINPRHLHRLDVDTSGLVLYAKHLLAQSFLNNQIENNLVQKRYYAIVEGKMDPRQGIIDLPIGRNRHQSNQYLVSKQGKPALTKYSTIKEANNQALLDVTLQTGRTHQIRVHLAHMHHPIVGDQLYGNPAARLMLHAYFLEFIHPRTRKMFQVKTKIPADFIITNEKS